MICEFGAFDMPFGANEIIRIQIKTGGLLSHKPIYGKQCVIDVIQTQPVDLYMEMSCFLPEYFVNNEF